MPFPTSGTYQRQYPRVTVLRGFNPNEPLQLSQAYPVASDVTILSGQVINAAWNSVTGQYEWTNVNTQGVVPYVALNDSADYDVISAGALPGLSCSGQFEIQTAFFRAADAALLIAGAPVAVDEVTPGLIKAYQSAGDVIIGYVTRNHGPLSLAGVDSSATNLNVVSFTTGFTGVKHA